MRGPTWGTCWKGYFWKCKIQSKTHLKQCGAPEILSIIYTLIRFYRCKGVRKMRPNFNCVIVWWTYVTVHPNLSPSFDFAYIFRIYKVLGISSSWYLQKKSKPCFWTRSSLWVKPSSLIETLALFYYFSQKSHQCVMCVKVYEILNVMV